MAFRSKMALHYKLGVLDKINGFLEDLLSNGHD